MLVGIELDEPRAGMAVKVAQASGFIINAANPTTIRLAPPLILTGEQADAFTAALPGIISRSYSEGEL